MKTFFKTLILCAVLLGSPFGEIDIYKFFDKNGAIKPEAEIIKICIDQIGDKPHFTSIKNFDNYRAYSYANRFKLFSVLNINHAEVTMEERDGKEEFQWLYEICVTSKEEAVSIVEDIVRTLNILDYEFEVRDFPKFALKVYSTIISPSENSVYDVWVECMAFYRNDRDYVVHLICKVLD